MKRNPNFVCIVCSREHRTLGRLMVCHSEGLRKVTGYLRGSEMTTAMLRNVLTNNLSNMTRRRLLMESGALSGAVR